MSSTERKKADEIMHEAFKIKDINKKILKLDEAIAVDPTFKKLYYKKGKFLYELKKYEESLKCYEKSIQLDPNDHICYHKKGKNLLKLKQYKQSLECYEKAIELKPDNVDYYFSKGNNLYNLEKYKESMKCYDKAIELKPDNASYYNNKGDCLYYMKKYKEALECYDKAIELKPDNASYYKNKGDCLYYMKKYKEALECYDKAIELKPDNASYHNKRGKCLKELKKYKESLKCYDKAIELDPNTADYYNNKGKSLKELKKYKESLEYYNKAIELDATNSLYFDNKARSLEKLQQYKEALENYDKAIQSDPNKPCYYYNKGNCLKKIQKYKKAVEYITKAIDIKKKQNIDNALYLANRASIYTQLKKTKLANNDFETVRELIKKDKLGDDLSHGNIKFLKGLFKQYEERTKILENYTDNTVSKNILQKAKDVLKNNYAENITKKLTKIQTKKFKKLNKEKTISKEEEKEIVEINLKQKISALQAKEKFTQKFTEFNYDIDIDLPILEEYIEGYKKQAEKIYNDAMLIDQEVKEIDNSNIVIDGAKAIISYIPFIGSFSDFINKVIDKTYNFYNETKINAKVENVLNFKPNKQDFDSTIEYILYTTLQDKAKIKFLLNDQLVEDLNTKHDQHKGKFIGALMNTIDKIKDATINRATDWAKEKILQKLKIITGPEPSAQLVLGQYEAIESIKTFISQGAYNHERKKLFDQYKKQNNVNKKVKIYHFKGHEKVLDPMILALTKTKFEYNITEAITKNENNQTQEKIKTNKISPNVSDAKINTQMKQGCWTSFKRIFCCYTDKKEPGNVYPNIELSKVTQSN